MTIAKIQPFHIDPTKDFTFGNTLTGNLKTDNLLYANGDPYVFTSSAAGANTQIQFNDGSSFAGDANLTFNKTTGTLTAKTITGNVSLGIANLRITGGTANYVLKTDGLGNLSWTAQASGGGGGTSGLEFASVVNTFTGDGSNSSFTLSVSPGGVNNTIVSVGGVIQPRAYYSVVDTTLTFSTAPESGTYIEVTSLGGNITSVMGSSLTVVESNQPNITSVGTLTNLNVSGNITSAYFIGDGSNLVNVPQLYGNSNVASYLPTYSGNLTANISNFKLTGGSSNNVLKTDGTGNLSWTTVAVAAGANNQIQFTLNNTLSADANLTFDPASSTLNAPNISGSLTSSSQPNITSLGFTETLGTKKLIQNLVSITGATGVVTHDTSAATIFWHSGVVANFTPNFTNLETTPNRVSVISIVVIQGATPYIPSALQINGTSQTIRWIGSTAPTGSPSKTDLFSFSCIYIGGTWVVLGQYANYG